MSTPVQFTASTTMRRPNATTKRPPNSPGNARSTGSTSTCAVSPKLGNDIESVPLPPGALVSKLAEIEVRVLLPLGEGGPKGRMRVHVQPSPGASRHPLPKGPKGEGHPRNRFPNRESHETPNQSCFWNEPHLVIWTRVLWERDISRTGFTKTASSLLLERNAVRNLDRSASVQVEDALNFSQLLRPRESKHHENPRVGRQHPLDGDNGKRLLHLAWRRHMVAGGKSCSDNDAAFLQTLIVEAFNRVKSSRGDDHGPGIRFPASLRPRIRILHVHTRQGREVSDVKLRHDGVPASRRVEKLWPVGRHDTDHPHFVRRKAACARIDLLSIARAKDSVVHHHHHAFASRLWGCCDSNGGQEIDRPVRADAGSRPLRAHDDNGPVKFHRQVQKECSFFQSRCPVGHDNSREVRPLLKCRINAPSELQPLFRRDVGARNIRKLLGLDLRVFPDLRDGS